MNHNNELNSFLLAFSFDGRVEIGENVEDIDQLFRFFH